MLPVSVVTLSFKCSRGGSDPPPPYYPRLERSLERLSNLPMVTQLVPAG